VDGLTWASPGDIREVTPIDLRWRAGLRALGRSALAIHRTVSSRCVNPLPFGDDGLLEIWVSDVKPVLCGQLDAHAAEPFVSANGERAPLLGAQLQGGEDAFPSVAVVDVNLLTPVREGRGAALADATIVHVPTFDERGKRPDVLGGRAHEGRPFYAGRLSFSMSPLLRELVVPLVQPFLVAREPSAVLLQLVALHLLAVTLFGLLLSLTGGKQAPGRVEERAPSPPRSAEDVGPLSPMAGGHALPVPPLLLHLAYPST
jgi:hypothetical protein